MKNYKFTIIISLLFLSFNGTSQTTQIRKFEDYPLKGIVKNHLDSNMEVVSTDTIRVGIFYQISQINNGFLLIEKIHYKKGNHDYYTNVEWLDSNLISQKKFGKVINYGWANRFLLEQKNNKFHLFDFQLEKYILSDATQILFEDKCFPNPDYDEYSYSEYNLKQHCYFTFILFQSPQKSGVLNVNGTEIFSFPSNLKLNYDNDNEIFTLHFKNQFDTYSLDGNKIASSVTKMHPIVTTLIKGYTYFGYENADGTMSLGTSQKLFVKNIKGSFLDIIADTNRFVAKLETGYVVFDTNGNQINTEPYDMIQPIRISQATLVKKNGIGYLVDRDLNPVNTNRFSYAELIGKASGDYVYYQTKLQNQTHKGFYLYDANGYQLLSSPIDAVYTPDNLTSFDNIYVKKDDLFAIQHSNGFTKFLYQKPEYAGDSDPGQITIAKRENKYVIIVDSIEYLSEYNLTKITAPSYINDDIYNPILFLFQGEKYSIGYMDINYTDPTSKYFVKLSGDFTITKSQVNHDIEEVYESYFNVKNDTKWGMYDLEYKVIIMDFELDKPIELSSEYSEFLKITKNGKVGLILPWWNEVTNMPDFQEVLPPEYDKIETGEEYAWIWKNKKEGVYSLFNKELIIPIQYDNISYSDNYDITILENNNLFGFTFLDNPNNRLEPVLTTKPTIILEGEFEDAIINGEKKVCQYDYSSNSLICFDKIEPFPNTDEYYYFWLDGKLGLYMKYDYDTLFPAEFKNITLSQNADYYLTETIEGKYGVRQYGNRVIIPEEFDELKEDTEFYTDIFLVKQSSSWGAYQNGRVELKIEYQSVELTDAYIIIQKDGKWGAVDHYFREVKPTQMDSKKALIEWLER